MTLLHEGSQQLENVAKVKQLFVLPSLACSVPTLIPISYVKKRKQGKWKYNSITSVL